MAGGEGTRLRPLTCMRPKPMVPVVNKPVMEHIVELLKRHGIFNIAVTLQYMPYAIKDYFEDGSEFGVKMSYYTEKIPLGTAGSVKNAEKFLDDTFIVISGDALTDINIKDVLNYHIEKDADATIVLKKVNIPLEYGVVVIDKKGRVTRFVEKPDWGEVFSDLANTGIYVLSPKVLNYIEKNKNMDFSNDIFPVMLKDNKKIYGYETESYWCDIGDMKAYMDVQRDILDKKVMVQPKGEEVYKGIWLEKGVKTGNDLIFKAPCVVGKNSIIGDNCYIGEYSIIGENNIISRKTSIKRGIIWNGCIIEKGIQMRGNIICNKVFINNGASLYENSVVGDETVINENATVKPDVRIWPSKIIDMNTVVNSNIVWGSKQQKRIFGKYGVSGKLNTMITGENGIKLGASYGTVFNGKGRAGVSFDGSRCAEMIKYAVISGLMSTGMRVYDLGNMIIPAARSAIRYYNFDGGVHISSSEECSRLTIDFLDKKGCSINKNIERKIQNTYTREDYIRKEGKNIAGISPIYDYKEIYLKKILSSVNHNMRYRILVTVNSKIAADTLNQVFDGLGCIGIIENNILNNIGLFSERVKKENFDLGVIAEESLEKMILVDETGKIVTDELFTAMITIIFLMMSNGKKMVVPVTASNVIEKIAEKNNASVLRTKTSSRDLMGKQLEDGLSDQNLEQVALNFDVPAALAKILNFMYIKGCRMSELTKMVPEIYIDRKEVECSWNLKGKVIKMLINEEYDKSIETLEGVKIFDKNGWVIVLPDSEKASCNIISESTSVEFARELSDIYAKKVKSINID